MDDCVRLYLHAAVCNCASGQTCIAPYTCRQGVELRLNGVILANNSVIELSRITRSCATLVCTTDLHTSRGTVGRWYYPNRTEIGNAASRNGLYVTHGSYREVYLHWRSHTRTPFGRYCCDHYNASISRQTLCIELGKPIYYTGIYMYIIVKVIVEDLHELNVQEQTDIIVCTRE